MYGELISSVTVGSGGASSIDFTSIPGTYTDLVIVLSGRVATTGQVSDIVTLRFNADSGSNYTQRRLYGNGSTTYSDTLSQTWLWAGWITANSATASTFGNNVIYIPNYAGSTAKTLSTDAVSENNATESYQALIAGRWSGTAAITQINLYCISSTNFNQYTTAYLYGLTKGSGGATVS